MPCAENLEAVFELAADSHVLAMTPTKSEAGDGRNSEVPFQLRSIARSQSPSEMRSQPMQITNQCKV
jgi:hypothetical protein